METSGGNISSARSRTSVNQTSPSREKRNEMPTADSLFINLLNSGVLERQTKKLEEFSFSWLASQSAALANDRNEAQTAASAAHPR